jgi:hypothetical protein
MTTVWVFNGVRASFPGGVFSTPDGAREWIAEHRLTGVLTAYPLDQGVYDWATGAGLFPANKPVDARFIASFSSAHQEHYHFVDGVQEGTG